MQWNSGPNAGFSSADAARLYLPVDPDPDRPTVADQRSDPSSTLQLVRDLIRLRRSIPALRTQSDQEVIHDGYPFAYIRGGTHLVVVNPRRKPAVLIDDRLAGGTVLIGSGLGLESTTIDGPEVLVDGFGYAVVTLDVP